MKTKPIYDSDLARQSISKIQDFIAAKFPECPDSTIIEIDELVQDEIMELVVAIQSKDKMLEDTQ